jgi:Transcriptional regulatory protein, C terminal
VTDLAERTSRQSGGTQLSDMHGTRQSLPVEVVDWPVDAGRREAFARAGVPRLLLVAPGAPPPDVIGVDEDWIRLPATDDDVLARAIHVMRLGERRRTDLPYVDDHRVLHRAGVSVPLTTRDARMLELLLRNVGSVVAYDELIRVVWSNDVPTREAVEAATYRLRRRISGLSMSIKAVRARGVVLHLDGSG